MVSCCNTQVHILCFWLSWHFQDANTASRMLRSGLQDRVCATAASVRQGLYNTYYIYATYYDPCVTESTSAVAVWASATAGHEASVSLQLHAAPRASRLRLQTRRTTEAKAEGQSKRSGQLGPFCGLPGALGGPHAAHHLAGSADLSTSLRSPRACADASAGIIQPFQHSQTVAKQRTVQCSGGAEFPCRCSMGKRAC